MKCPYCGNGSIVEIGAVTRQCDSCDHAWEAEPPKPYVVSVGLVVERVDGAHCVEVARCIHCERITIGPKSRCSCGAELYPLAAMVELGEAWDVAGWLSK